MPYLICRKCKGYYELQKDESLENFESCICKGKLEYAENLNKLVYSGNTKTKKNLKMIEALFNYKWIFTIFAASVIITILVVFYFNYLIYLVMVYSVPLSVLLVVLTNLRFILNELDTDNSIIKFIQLNSIFMIIPLFILFISIIVSRII